MDRLVKTNQFQVWHALCDSQSKLDERTAEGKRAKVKGIPFRITALLVMMQVITSLHM